MVAVSNKLVVVVYDQDLPQFRVFCHCLNKYWQDTRNLTVVVGKPDVTQTYQSVKSIVDQNFSSGWNIEIQQGSLDNHMDGYQEQQLFKVIASLDELCQDAVVFDCKDFLLKPMGFGDFKEKSKYKVAVFTDDKKTFQDFYPSVATAFNFKQAIPLPLILTPWIWQRNQLQKYWQKIQDLFGHDYSSWSQYPTGSEWASYYAFTCLDGNSTVEFDTTWWMPIGGCWKHQTVDEIQQQADMFDQYPDRKIWKHHRTVTDFEKINITAIVLKSHGISTTVVDTWIDEINTN
jgi:hypothetical protein